MSYLGCSNVFLPLYALIISCSCSFLCALPLHLSELKTPATAAAIPIQTVPRVTHRLTAATPPAPLQMTVTAAVTAPPHPHPPRLQIQTQEAAVIQIRDLQRKRKRRNKPLNCLVAFLFSQSVHFRVMKLRAANCLYSYVGRNMIRIKLDVAFADKLYGLFLTLYSY